MKAIEELLALVETETGVNDICEDHPDDDSVGWNGDGQLLPMTFGLIRRARAELEELKAQ